MNAEWRHWKRQFEWQWDAILFMVSTANGYYGLFLILFGILINFIKGTNG